MSQFTLLTGREELFPQCAEMAGELYLHLSKKSTYYKGEKMRWLERSRSFSKQSYDLKVFLVLDGKSHHPLAYTVVCLYDKGKTGVIEDLYVREKYRGIGLGDKLMCSALNWLKEAKIQNIKVAYGYEELLRFCKKYNFYPKEYNLFLK